MIEEGVIFWINKKREINDKQTILLIDMDSTLIKTKSKKKFPLNKDDWEFLYPVDKIKERMKKYDVYIISNQSGATGVKAADLIKKFKKIAKILNVKGFYIATDEKYRKPSPRIFERFILGDNFRALNLKTIKHILMVGDAAGRENDFSNSDYAFIYNVGIIAKNNNPDIKIYFKVPEDFFDNVKFTIPAIKNNFRSYWKIKNTCVNIKNEIIEFLKSSDQCIVLLVGPPASGKSTFCKEFENNNKFLIVSNDKQSNPLKIASTGVLDNKSIIVDNTNSTIENRSKYINLSELKLTKLPVYAINFLAYNSKCELFDLSKENNLQKQKRVCEYLNKYRAYTTGRVVPQIAINIYYSKYTKPTEKEKIEKIFNMPFYGKYTYLSELIF